MIAGAHTRLLEVIVSHSELIGPMIFVLLGGAVIGFVVGLLWRRRGSEAASDQVA
jgi:hypothetical protein